MMNLFKRLDIPGASEALTGRAEPIPTSARHFVTGEDLKGPYPEDYETAAFAMGCFWGAEKLFWQVPGVHVTAVGYAAGYTPNPAYEEVCSGLTGHNEVVLVIYDPAQVAYTQLLKIFWEGHNPTQGMRQGNDVGTQYRSGIYVFNAEQREQAEASKRAYQQALTEQGHNTITTEILDVSEFYYAEDYHQQYLAKNPNGYCGLGGTGVSVKV